MAAALPNRSHIRTDKYFINNIWDKCLTFFDNEAYTDVTFLWRSSKKRVTAHRVIVAASSTFFDELFQTPRGIAPAIYIDEISPEPFELLIAYCYSGKLYPKNYNVAELLNAATILKLDGAIAICAAYLTGGMNKPQTARNNTKSISSPVAQSSELNRRRVFDLGADLGALRFERSTTINSNKTTARNTKSVSAQLAVSAVSSGSRVPYSILAVQKCDLQKNNISCIYRCDETEKKWLQYGVIKFLSKLSDFVYYNKSLISVGGSEDGRPRNNVYSYNLINHRWTSLPAMTTQRSDLCVAIINNVLYAIGGSDTESKPLSIVEKFDLRKTISMLWLSVPSMFTPRRKATTVAVGNLIYVFGGLGIDWKQLRTVECYNIETSTWSKCADMHEPRHDCGVSVLNDFIFVIGSGNLPPYSRNVEYYNPQADIWTKIAPLIVARSGICGVTFCGGLFAVGGFLPNCYKGVVEMYNKTQNAWEKTMTLPAGGTYKCFSVPTAELVEIEKARKLSISLTVS